MKISVVSSLFVNYQINDAVDVIIQMDIDGIDLWCGRPHIYRHDLSLQFLKFLKKKLSSAKVAVASLMPAFFRYPYSLSSPIESIRQDSIGYLRDCIDNAVVMGAPHVLVVPTHSLYGQSTDNALTLFIRSLEEINPYAISKNMRLAIEIVYPQLSDYMNSTQDALNVISALNTKNIGVVIDSGHLNLSGEELENAIKKLGDRLWQVHINDNDGKVQQNAVPGEGKFNFDRFINLLRTYGYDDYLSLELGWNYSFDPVPALQEAISRTKNFL